MPPNPPNRRVGAAQGRPPHPATVVQPKPAFGVTVERAPHAATVAQPRRAFGGMVARPPHPATVAQPASAPRRATSGRALPPHPATVVQRSAPHSATLAPGARRTASVAGSVQRASDDAPSFKKAHSLEVKQNEIIITAAGGPKPILGTVGLGPCVALVVKGEGIVALAHLDGSPMNRTLQRVIAHMGNPVALTAQIYGCSAGLAGHADRAEQTLTELGVKVLKRVVHNTPSESDSHNLNLAVDVETGAVLLDIKFSWLGKRDNAGYPERPYRGELVWSLLDESTCKWNGDDFDRRVLSGDVPDDQEGIEYRKELAVISDSSYPKIKLSS